MHYFQTADLNCGESKTVEWRSGKKTTITLYKISERRDAVRHAVRSARADIEINGQKASLTVGNYRLPQKIECVWIDCPVISGYLQAVTKKNFLWHLRYLQALLFRLIKHPLSFLSRIKARWESLKSTTRTDVSQDLRTWVSLPKNRWGLLKDARFRLWSADMPILEPNSFVYPVKQRWFASDTQMGNEPTYVDGREKTHTLSVKYHCASDIGGVEGAVEVVASTKGWIAAAGDRIAKNYDAGLIIPRSDVVYIIDAKGWLYRYSHLVEIDPLIEAGTRVQLGQRLGRLGKEGASGGWAHLHFEIQSPQPSGFWGIQDSYIFLWKAYLAQYAPEVVAVARPHHLAYTGQPVVLDGKRSWCRSGPIKRYQWTLTDGSISDGATIERVYSKPGTYSEILKVCDNSGHISYDFSVVQVLDAAHPRKLPPTIHAAFSPTLGIKTGEPVTFAVRSFRTKMSGETWDFGDGSPPVRVQSNGNSHPHATDGYAMTVHRYSRPGDYIVNVSHLGSHGFPAIAHLYVHVEPLDA